MRGYEVKGALDLSKLSVSHDSRARDRSRNIVGAFPKDRG